MSEERHPGEGQIGATSGPSPASGQEPGEDASVAELVLDVSERVSILVREEVELAKTEVSEKVTKLLRGSVVGLAAGVFALGGLVLLLHTVAWLLGEEVFGEIWLGYLVSAGIWFVLAGVAGLIARRAVQAGAPPTPDMAIEEARLTRDTLSKPEDEE